MRGKLLRILKSGMAGLRTLMKSSCETPVTTTENSGESPLCPKQNQLDRDIRGMQQVYGSPGSCENHAWMVLVEEVSTMYDQIVERQSKLSPDQQAITEHVLSQLREILERNGVTIVEDDTSFDPLRHRPDAGSPAITESQLVEIISPGFAVGPRVLRRATVRPQGLITALLEVQ